MAGPSAGRRGSNWRRLTANLKAQRGPCALCGQAINYTLDWTHPQSFSVDHKLPRDRYPHLAEDPTNLQAAHLACNSSKGNRVHRPGLGTTSRNW